jgi:hypothetical protein
VAEDTIITATVTATTTSNITIARCTTTATNSATTNSYCDSSNISSSSSIAVICSSKLNQNMRSIIGVESRWQADRKALILCSLFRELNFFNFPLYLQSVPIHSANIVKSYIKACTSRRVLTSTLLYLIGSESSCDLGGETYKLNLKNYICNYNKYILNLVGRSIGKFFHNRLVSGGSCMFRISSFGCSLRRLL